MGVGVGPKSITDSLALALDSGANFRGFTKYGTAGTNNSNRSAVNLIDKSTIDIANTSNIVTSLASPANQYTMYGLTYPEGSQTPSSRDGITPGFNNTSAGKSYSCSRDLNYFVFDDDSNSWVADSYFNGERISGHSYDTYDGEPSQHQKFQDDHATIHDAFPNATHIIIGSHAAENNDNDTDTLAILQSLGLPDSHIGVDRPEYILVGKKNKPSTQSYVRENVSSAVAHLNVLLPLDQTQGVLTFDGSNDYADLGSDITISGNGIGWTAEYVFNTNSASTLQHFNSAEADDFNANWLALYNSKLAVWDHGQGVWKYGDTVFSSNTWYHIAFVQVTGTSMQYYVNGVAEGGDHTSFTFSSDYSALKTRYIGRYEYNGSYGRYFNGEIPVVKMYSKALTADEVARNYNMYKNRFDI